MARGGYRPGSGRPKGATTAPRERDNVLRDVKIAAASVKMTPLEYMLAVVNSEDADPVRRDRMAAAAAPYVHAKKTDEQTSKKEERQKTAEQKMAAGGRFTAPPPPRSMN